MLLSILLANPKQKVIFPFGKGQFNLIVRIYVGWAKAQPTFNNKVRIKDVK